MISVPGASAITTAIAAAGLQSASFCFHGFLPARKGEREKMLVTLKAQCELQVFYEAPHRIVECIASIAAVFGGDRRIGIARELTKLFEQVHVCRLDEAIGLAGAEREPSTRGIRSAGGRLRRSPRADESDTQRVLEILLQELPLKQAVGLAAEITGTKKNALYEKALKLKKESGAETK